MPTMQEIDKREKQLRACVPATWMPALEPIFAAARRGVEADSEIESLRQWQRDMVAKAADKSLDGYRELGAKCAALEERAEQLESELAALKVERDSMRHADALKDIKDE